MGQKTVLYGLSLFLCICCIGCSEDILDPRQVGRFNPIPVENVILDTLGVVDEPLNTYVNALEPFPEDIIPANQDYVFGSGDIVRISIYELREEGVPFIDDYIITETGKISIPDVGVLYATGLTESALEDEIKSILSPDILVSPSVKVVLNKSESQIFSIEGEGINRASRYNIPRYSFRLLDALALAGGVAQYNVSHVYVTRQVTGKESVGSDAAVTGGAASYNEVNQKAIKVTESNDSYDEGLFELITPSYSMGFTGKSGMLITASEMPSDDELEVLAAPEGIASKRDSQKKFKGSSASGQVEWVFEDGKYVPVAVDAFGSGGESGNARKDVATGAQNGGAYGWDEVGSGGTQSRIIKIPVDKLFGGDQQYNIIIRPGDVVRVPRDVVGDFYVIGNVRDQNTFSLTGKQMTLVQAIAVARGLDELAWPTKVEVTRRIGRNRQVIVMVNLKKIAAGLQPDFFIKPNDTINVGSHVAAKYLFSLRNAFTARYGFGFTYDRNFAYSNDDGRFN